MWSWDHEYKQHKAADVATSFHSIPITAVIEQGETLFAFANVWRGGGKHELSIDLMRHVPDAPHGVMELLFVELMLYGHAENYAMANTSTTSMGRERTKASSIPSVPPGTQQPPAASPSPAH
ncbi:hypothetical protein K227x_37370 [Rubripirellula lacrimiformis]|uniref:Phosphatidylglycerol lysyltransferase C-terminal domain-containing protein n=1 Tax=Rubripirellula lacrimiformis TaxID=1930273 RepID=A0A517NDY3_9BACT|nr:hypothetical protein K227x_37370 [Rubripirellula lacrimiformis]